MSDSSHPPKLSKEQIDSVIALYSNGQYHEAIGEINSLIKNFAEDSMLHNILGACYAGLGQFTSSF